MSDRMDIKEACALTSQFGRFLQGLDRLQEAAAELENADQVVAERRATAEDVSGEISQLEAKLSSLRADADAARLNIARSVENAQRQAADIVAAANAQALDIRTAAKKEASEARDEAQGIISRKEAAVRELKDARAELEQVAARLAQAKDEGRKIFGGA
jgi:chromosome segregation ATPase